MAASPACAICCPEGRCRAIAAAAAPAAATRTSARMFRPSSVLRKALTIEDLRSLRGIFTPPSVLGTLTLAFAIGGLPGSDLVEGKAYAEDRFPAKHSCAAEVTGLSQRPSGATRVNDEIRVERRSS